MWPSSRLIGPNCRDCGARGISALFRYVLEPMRLAGVVSQAGWCHRVFEREWLDAVGHLEYAFE